MSELTELLRRDNVKIKVRESTADIPDWMVDGSTGWNVTLSRKGEHLRVPFYKGPGHQGNPPTVEEVTECVLADASLLDDYDSERRFIDEMGYETSRQGRRVYKAVVDQTKKVRRWLGEDFETYLYAEH